MNSILWLAPGAGCFIWQKETRESVAKVRVDMVSLSGRRAICQSAKCCGGKKLCYKNGRLFLQPWELCRRDTCTLLTRGLTHATQSIYYDLFLPCFPFAQASVVGEEIGDVSFYTVDTSCVNYVGEPCPKSGVVNLGCEPEVTKTRQTLPVQAAGKALGSRGEGKSILSILRVLNVSQGGQGR